MLNYYEVSGGLVADTPGFSSLEFDHIEREELPKHSSKWRKKHRRCKFRGCLHLKEPKCAVKEQVENGNIPRHRYENYLQFMQEITDRKPRYEKND